jgi:hypothetical protein
MKLTLLTVAFIMLASQLKTGNVWLAIATFIIAAIWLLDIRKFFIQ